MGSLYLEAGSDGAEQFRPVVIEGVDAELTIQGGGAPSFGRAGPIDDVLKVEVKTKDHKLITQKMAKRSSKEGILKM